MPSAVKTKCIPCSQPPTLLRRWCLNHMEGTAPGLGPSFSKHERSTVGGNRPKSALLKRSAFAGGCKAAPRPIAGWNSSSVKGASPSVPDLPCEQGVADTLHESYAKGPVAAWRMAQLNKSSSMSLNAKAPVGTVALLCRATSALSLSHWSLDEWLRERGIAYHEV